MHRHNIDGVRAASEACHINFRLLVHYVVDKRNERIKSVARAAFKAEGIIIKLEKIFAAFLLLADYRKQLRLGINVAQKLAAGAYFRFVFEFFVIGKEAFSLFKAVLCRILKT